MKKAIVIGGTGATGKSLLKILAQSPTYTEIRALVRTPKTEIDPRIQQVQVDFNHLNEYRDAISGDVAFSCLGTTLKAAGSQEAQWKVDYEYQLEFAKIAKQQGVSTFVLMSSKMANAQSSNFYVKMKGQLEDAITALDFPTLIILRPSLLLRPNTDRFGEKVSAALLKILNSIGLFKAYQPVRVERVAQVMVDTASTYHHGVHIIEPVV